MTTFVVPPLDGPETGGTRYNREFIGALRQIGERPEVLSLEQAEAAVAEPRDRTVWLDSAWMAALPRLAEVRSPRCRIGMLTHYLPSLVSHGANPAAAALSDEERAALGSAEAFIATSDYLAAELAGLGVEPSRTLVLEPGIELPVAARPAAPQPDAPLQAIMIANVLEGKGLAPLLDGLAAHLRPSDSLLLVVVGSLQMEPEYAERCASLVERHPGLRERVRLVGSFSYRECIEALLRADLLVSASRMESFGMALTDARATGRPILARPGGNIAAHVDPRWGGQLVPDADALARALVRLARDRGALAERQRRAWAHRPQHPWTDVAERLRATFGRWPPPRPPQ